MKDEIVSFHVAKLAKKKGFKQNPYNTKKCYRPKFSDGSKTHLSDSLFAPEYNICVAPTQSILQRWLREEHNIHVSVFRLANKWTSKPFDIIYSKYLNLHGDYKKYDTYEQALEAGLFEALKLID